MQNYKLRKWVIKYWFIIHIIQIPVLFMATEIWPEYSTIIVGIIGLIICWMYWFIPHMLIEYQHCTEILKLIKEEN